MLTPRQKAFADYYIALGNASEAARKAGYSEKNANNIGSENLAKPEIQAYIKVRMESQDQERVASADEVLRFYTAVMRGQEKDAFGLDVAMTERLKAADSLMKRYAAGAEKQKDTIAKLDSLLKEMKNAAMDA